MRILCSYVVGMVLAILLMSKVEQRLSMIILLGIDITLLTVLMTRLGVLDTLAIHDDRAVRPAQRCATRVIYAAAFAAGNLLWVWLLWR